METSTPEAEGSKSTSLLAQELFGGNFHGEVKVSEKPVEQPATAAPEEPEEPVEKVSLEDAQGSGEEAETNSEEEGVTISTFDELVESQGWDPEWANSLEIPVKVDGESSKAKIADLVKSYQMTQAAEKRLEEAKEKAKSQYQALAEKQKELDATVRVAASVLQKQLDQVGEEEKSVDWKTLESQDPGEAALKRQKFAERRAAVRGEIGELAKAYQQHQQKTELETHEKQAQKLLQEREALLTKLPEWKDEDTAAAEQKSLTEYLHSQELSEDAIHQTAFDHKLLIIARKAMLYDQIKQKAEPAKKKLVKVPKTLKPGSPKPESNSNQTQINELQKRISANPNSADALDAAREIVKLRRGTK